MIDQVKLSFWELTKKKEFFHLVDQFRLKKPDIRDDETIYLTPREKPDLMHGNYDGFYIERWEKILE